MHTPGGDIHFIVPRFRSREFDTASREDWTVFLKWLHESGRNVSSIPSAATLCISLARGVRWRLQRQALPGDFTKPSIGIEDLSRPPLKMETAMNYSVPTKIIGVSPLALNQHALVDPSDVVRLTPASEPFDPSRICYEGTIPDMYLLGGVEEADHALYFHKHPESAEASLSQPGSKSFAEYDAQDHEFLSLQARVDAAEELSLPSVTIDFLRRKFDAALQVREKRTS